MIGFLYRCDDKNFTRVKSINISDYNISECCDEARDSTFYTDEMSNLDDMIFSGALIVPIKTSAGAAYAGGIIVDCDDEKIITNHLFLTYTYPDLEWPFGDYIKSAGSATGILAKRTAGAAGAIIPYPPLTYVQSGPAIDAGRNIYVGKRFNVKDILMYVRKYLLTGLNISITSIGESDITLTESHIAAVTGQYWDIIFEGAGVTVKDTISNKTFTPTSRVVWVNRSVAAPTPVAVVCQYKNDGSVFYQTYNSSTSPGPIWDGRMSLQYPGPTKIVYGPEDSTSGASNWDSTDISQGTLLQHIQKVGIEKIYTVEMADAPWVKIGQNIRLILKSGDNIRAQIYDIKRKYGESTVEIELMEYDSNSFLPA